jgi:hypothetical protein
MAERDLVLVVARRLVCEELRNWVDLVSEIIRERLKHLHLRRSDFHTVRCCRRRRRRCCCF